MDAQTDAGKAKALTHKETRLIVWGVLLPLFMGSIDNTILATALPTIGHAFGDVHGLPWLITIYLLAATAAMPLYGKIADIRGRRFALYIAIAAYMAGSLVCALAPSMLVLICGRALQGLGGAGLSAVAIIVLGDAAAPKERGPYYAWFSVVYTTAGAIGPALGGFIADHLHWSVIFWLNIPLGLGALWITSTVLRRLPRHERPHRLDVIGAILIVTASVAFMLGAQSRRPQLPLAVTADHAPVRRRARPRRRLRVAPPHRARAADPDRDPARSDRVLGGGRQLAGLGRDHRAQHFPADVPAERDRAFADQCGAEPDGADDEPQHQRRARRPGARPRAALQDPADLHDGDRAGRGDDAGTVGGPHDHRVVRSAAVPDRSGVRAAAVAVLRSRCRTGSRNTSSASPSAR